jgi:hypothetical protein
LAVLLCGDGTRACGFDMITPAWIFNDLKHTFVEYIGEGFIRHQFLIKLRERYEAIDWKSQFRANELWLLVVTLTFKHLPI